MIIALLIFALTAAFTAAATVIVMGFSFWIALIAYPLAGFVALLLGAALVACGKMQHATEHQHNDPLHA